MSRARRVFGGIALGFAILLVLVLVYALTLGPRHASQLQAEAADGATAFEVASASSGLPEVTAEPGSGWQVQPLVQQLQVPVVKDLPRPPLPNDPRVALGLHSGVMVTSPDRGFVVELSVVPGAANAEAETKRLQAEITPADEEPEPVLSETLASGSVVHHVGTADALHGALDVNGVVVQVEARVTGDADDADRSLNDYRPALAALLESLQT